MAGKRPGKGSLKRVLIVEDHPMMRECLAALISSEPGLTVCGEADSEQRGLELAAKTHPDLVLLDLCLKDSHGLDLIHALHTTQPELAILVVSMHDERLQAERALKAGARGYIDKQQAGRNVLKAVRTVLAGQVYLSERMIARLLTNASGKRRGGITLPIERLTDRELRVFELLGNGTDTKEIARQFGVDIRTVETYRARIKTKLAIRNSFDLLQHAIRWAEQRPASGSEEA